MKKKSILSVILVAFCMLTVISLAACGTKTVKQIKNDYGAVVEGGGFRRGMTLVTNTIENDSEKAKEVVELINNMAYNKESDMKIYDIFVSDDGKEIQPDGKVKITIPAPFESESGYITFHIRSNNVVEALKTDYEDGNISFETDSFSTFILTPKLPDAAAGKSTLRLFRSGEGGNLNVWVDNENKSAPSTSYENDIECGIYSEIMLSAYIFNSDTHDFIGWY
ncbi:MAG: hypothetical protein ACI3XQ_01855, partial [Eubacteriales bacterium]